MVEKEKDNIIFAIIGIVFSMLALPITTVLDKSLPVWIILSVYIIWMVLSGKRGYSFILLAVCSCRLSVTSDDFDLELISSLFRYYFYFIVLIPAAIIAILYLKRQRRNKFQLPIVLIIVFFTIEFIYGQQLPVIISTFVSTCIAFSLGYSDHLDFKQTFILYSIIIIITILYAGIEFHLGIGPYSVIYLSTAGYYQGFETHRAVGLTGNPLLLLSYGIIYQALICNYALVKSKYPILPQLLCIYLFIIVVSRTAVLAFFVFLIFYFFLSSQKFSPKILGAFIILIIGTIWIGNTYLSDSFEYLFYRLSNSETMHRVSSVGTVWNILKSNLFGIGFENYADELQKYAALGKEANVNTLDNFYMTQLAHFGIFGMIIIYYYMYYIIQFLRLKFKKENRKEFSLLFIAFFIISICFDFDAYFNIVFVLYSLVGNSYYRAADQKSCHR